MPNWPTNKLWANPDNPRRDIETDPDWGGFLISVESQGIIQPLLIRSDGMILAGHRRHKAALVVGLEFVPVKVFDGDSNPVLIPLIENLQRSDLTVLEVAEYLRMCSRDHDMTSTAISEVTEISAGTVSKYLKLADAPIELKERIERDEIPLNAAFELLRHDEEFIREVIKTPRLTKQIVRDRAGTVSQSRVQPISALKAKCPSERIAHLEYAINAVRELLEASPNEALSVRYKRWILVMQNDLADERKVEISFRGATDAFQRQPKAASLR